MSALGSILGYRAPSYVTPQVPAPASAQVSAQLPSDAASILSDATNAAAQTVVGAQASMAQAMAAAQATAAQTVTNSQNVAATQTAAAKAAVTGTSGIAPLAPTVLAQLIAAQSKEPQAAVTPDPGLAAASSGTDPKTVFLNYMKETPAQQMEDSWLANHHLTAKQLAAMPAAEREAIEKRMQAEIKEKITQDSENKLKAKSISVA
jgi:DNA-binding transcriptional regulator YdaS (Cro superfamily)